MRNRRFLPKVVAAAVVVLVLGTLIFRNARNPSLAAYYQESIPGTSQENEAAPDLSGSVTGLIVDDSDAPIRAIKVELIPLDKTGDQRWYATRREWTNQRGQYVFSEVEPGEYILAVHKNDAPDARHPFAGTYYPGVDAEADADQIHVSTGPAVELHRLQLQRVSLVTLKVSVEFEDGSQPAWSNLLFHNPSFPQQAVIGDEAPGVTKGRGEFTLPVGFDYYAAAKVDCAGGDRIETRESRPVQRLHIEENDFPDELKFIIPGPPCPLWSPK